MNLSTAITRIYFIGKFFFCWTAFIFDMCSSILAVSCQRFSICSHSSVTICRLILGFCSNLDKILVIISSSGAVSHCTKIRHLHMLRVSSFNLNLSHSVDKSSKSRVILPPFSFFVRFKHCHLVLNRELFCQNFFSELRLSPQTICM